MNGTGAIEHGTGTARGREMGIASGIPGTGIEIGRGRGIEAESGTVRETETENGMIAGEKGVTAMTRTIGGVGMMTTGGIPGIRAIKIDLRGTTTGTAIVNETGIDETGMTGMPTTRRRRVAFPENRPHRQEPSRQ